MLLTVSFAQQWWALPPSWNPWAPLDINHPINPVTYWKLKRLKDRPDECRGILAELPDSAVDYLPLEDYTPVESCPLRNVLRMRESGVKFNAPFTISCPVAVTWLMFERQALQPAAESLLGAKIHQVDHLGSFSCRNIANSPTGRRSQHATASALDIAGFRLVDGQVISVLEHWDSEQSPDKAEFLHQVGRAACDFFGTVLGPEYNQAHLNHFHFDNSGFRFCR